MLSYLTYCLTLSYPWNIDKVTKLLSMYTEVLTWYKFSDGFSLRRFRLTLNVIFDANWKSASHLSLSDKVLPSDLTVTEMPPVSASETSPQVLC